MNKSDQPRFATAIAALSAAFAKQSEPALIEAYYMALEDLEIEAVEIACREAIRGCEYFPRPVHLRRFVEADSSGSAVESWHDMVKIGHGPHGPYVSKKPHPTDEVANKAMALMGPMPQMSDWEGPWAEKKFVELYETIAEREAAQGRLRLSSRPQKRLERGK